MSQLYEFILISFSSQVDLRIFTKESVYRYNILVPSDVSHSLLLHLKWMIQKDLLGQDIFLIGSPGPLRRRLALMYLVRSLSALT